MHSKEPQRDALAQGDGATAAVGPDDGRTGQPRLSRRQAMGRMSAVATAGAVAWVVPEILTAKPAAGAALSNAVGGGGGGASGGVSTSASTGGTGASVGASGNVGTNGPDDASTVADTTGTSPSSLAFTGFNLQRDAEVGAALVAGGWAMRHWASRTPKPAVAGPAGTPQAEGMGGGN
jgi:hypothetical protein